MFITGNNLLYLFLAIQPLLDVLTLFIYRQTGIMLGTLIRGSIFTIVFIIFIFRGFNKKQFYSLIIFITTFILYYLTHLIYNYKISGGANFEIYGLIKFLYLPLMLKLLTADKFDFDFNKLDKSIRMAILLIIMSFIVSTITGTNEYAYRTMSKGNAGWFFSANEIATILGIIFPFCFYSFIEVKNKKNLLLLSTVLIPILLIGVKTPLLSIGGTFLSYLFIKMFKFFKKGIKLNEFILIALYPMIIMILFFLFLNSDAFDTYVYRANVIYKGTGLITRILNARDIMLLNNIEIFKNYFPLGFVVGIASIVNISEMDFFDIVINYGFLGSLIIIHPILNLFSNNFKSKFWTHLYRPTYLKYFLPVLMGILIAFLSGHTLGAPSVSIYLSVFIIASSTYISKFN